MSYIKEDLVYRTIPEPTEINIGDIFIEDEWYYKRAEWCNSHNCFIQEITQPDDVVRYFQIQEIPDPTDEELAKQVRDITKQDGFPRDITFPELEEKLNA